MLATVGGIGYVARRFFVRMLARRPYFFLIFYQNLPKVAVALLKEKKKRKTKKNKKFCPLISDGI